eukprot:UN05189
MVEAVHLLQEQQIQTMKEREELLNELEAKYSTYIHSLLQQKRLIAANIRNKYDAISNAINDAIYNCLSSKIMITNINQVNSMNHLIAPQNNYTITSISVHHQPNQDQTVPIANSNIDLKKPKEMKHECDAPSVPSLPSFKCEKCNKSFKKKAYLSSHIHRVHNGRKFECDVCHKKYKQKETLVRHKRIHSGERPYKCDVCSKSI